MTSKNTEAKTRRTAAVIFRALESRLETEKKHLAVSRNDVRLLEARIELIRELIDDANPNGKKEEEGE